MVHNKQATNWIPSPYASLSNSQSKHKAEGFLYRSRDKNPPAIVQETGVPFLVSACHMPWGNYAHGPELPHPYSRASESKSPSP